MEIGKEYGITKERVRQIESRLKNKIREYMKAEIPDFNDLDAAFEEKDE
jgi:RNA polymerase sigma-32 factor